MNKSYTVTLTLPDGKRKYFRGATKAEAEAKRDVAKSQLASGINLSDNSTVNQWAETWMKEYKEGTVRPITYNNLRNTLDLYILPTLGPIKVREVKPAHISRMVRAMSGKAESTQRIAIRVAKEMFTVAVENDMLLKNPCTSSIKPNGTAPKDRVPLTKAQSDELLDAARGTKLYPFVLVAMYSGLRKEEILGLMWKDIDFDRGIVSPKRSVVCINGKSSLVTTLKTDSAYRSVPLPWPVLEELSQMRAKSKSLYVVPGRNGAYMASEDCQNAWRTLAKKVPFHVHSHLLRHTCVTRWLESGLDIKELQYLAGHSSADITMGIYAHYLEGERLDATAEKIRAVM